MKHPLIRQGEGPSAAYAKAWNERQDREHQLARIAAEYNSDEDPALAQACNHIATYGLGDAAQLRGIPAVGVKGGWGGAIRGTRPGDTSR